MGGSGDRTGREAAPAAARGWPRARATAGVVAVALVLAVGPAACAHDGGGRSSGIRPLDGRPAASSTAPRDAAVPPAPTPPPSSPTVAPDGPGDEAAAGAAQEAIDELLTRYDRVLTDLAAHPEAVADPGHPLVAAWRAVVAPGTALAEDVPAAIESRRAAGVRIDPGPTGTSYRHRSLEVVPAADGSSSFTWCSWSPGIGRDRATEAVVDDAVGIGHGTGRAHLEGRAWVLDALDQTELVARPPGTADPCPAEVAGSGPPSADDGSGGGRR